MFSQIHEIVFYGNGYDWETVYNMPIWLRKFTYEKIKKHFEDKKEAQDKANNIVTGSDPKKPIRPDITPTSTTYNAKAPKSK